MSKILMNDKVGIDLSTLIPLISMCKNDSVRVSASKGTSCGLATKGGV